MRLVAEVMLTQEVKLEHENQIRGIPIMGFLLKMWQEVGEDGEDAGQTAKGMMEYNTDCRQLPPKSQYGH